MSIVYRKVKRVLNFREAKPEVYKLHQLTFPQVSFAELVDECSESCGVNRAQTKAVADALLNRIIMYMKLGHGVRLGDFGTFKPTFTAKTVKTLNELNEETTNTVKRKKVSFYPGGAFRNMMSNMSMLGNDELDVKE